jgi:hypothetical protein
LLGLAGLLGDALLGGHVGRAGRRLLRRRRLGVGKLQRLLQCLARRSPRIACAGKTPLADPLGRFAGGLLGPIEGLDQRVGRLRGLPLLASGRLALC